MVMRSGDMRCGSSHLTVLCTPFMVGQWLGDTTIKKPLISESWMVLEGNEGVERDLILFATDAYETARSGNAIGSKKLERFVALCLT